MKSQVFFIFVLLVTFTITSCGPQRQTGEREADQATAIAEMNPASGSQVRGLATFVETNDGVKMTLELTGLKPNGVHALHLHEFGDCSAPDATSAGGHWNPTGERHGDRHGTGEFHRGDIDNIEADSEGRGRYETTVKDWTIGGDQATNILGKSVIIHVDEDDFVSQPTGDAGDRISCGVIVRQ
jgi:superoxide dismutase, Cu-Zn family